MKSCVILQYGDFKNRQKNASLTNERSGLTRSIFSLSNL